MLDWLIGIVNVIDGDPATSGTVENFSLDGSLLVTVTCVALDTGALRVRLTAFWRFDRSSR